MDQTISLATSIAACLSAIAAFLVVLQVAKQRAASYKPELVIARAHFRCKQDKDGRIPHRWTTPDDESSQRLLSFSVPLVNVGLGAAKEVKLCWDFPISNLVSRVNALTDELSIDSHFVWDDEDTLSERASDGSRTVHSWKGQKATDIDFVLPASIENESTKATIPFAYIHLVSAFVYLMTTDEKIDTFCDVPGIALKIQYRDIGGVRRSTRFLVKVHLTQLHFGDRFEFQGTLESVRKN